VFEPNDEGLWKRVNRNITAFLLRVYNSGALMGKTPEEAFYVKCDSETNPPEVVDAGQMVCEIGISPAKPAEFVIFRIGQMAGQAKRLSAPGTRSTPLPGASFAVGSAAGLARVRASHPGAPRHVQANQPPAAA